MNWKVLSAVVIVLAIAAGAWFYLQKSTEQDDVEPVAELETPDTAPQKTVKETLAVESEPDYQESMDTTVEPPAEVDNSDEIVRQAAGDLSEKLGTWLSPQYQLRKWVAMVDQMAAYKLPNKNLPVAYPKEKFLAVKTPTGMENDPGNYRRWNTLVNTVTSLDPKRVAVYYKKWSPLLEDSYNELGNPQSFDNQFRTTIEHLVTVEPIPANAELRRPKVFYEYADPVLENADPLSKWLWRLGPDNMVKLQAWLKELSQYL